MRSYVKNISKDRKIFSLTAKLTKKININPRLVMRGGIRL